MEVILLQDITGLGKASSVVKVKDGYARNYLMPNKLAVLSTRANLKKIESEQKSKASKAEQDRKQAEALKEKLAGHSLTIPMLVHEDEKLYGSITSIELERALIDEGFAISKSQILLEEPIKALGIYEVPIELYRDVRATIKVWVVKK